MSGATFACQIAWLEPLMKGRMKEEQNDAMDQTRIPRPRPMRTEPRTPPSTIPPRTPWTRRFGPPQALSAIPPETPPIAAAEFTAPRISASFPERERIIAMTVAKPIGNRKFTRKNTSWRPRRLRRAAMYRNPNALSERRFPRAFRPASETAGCGMRTARRIETAARNVTMSIPMITGRPEPNPKIPMRAPANNGAKTCEMDCAAESIPLARPYWDFGIIVEIAAEYAGHWNASKAPSKAPATYQCQTWRAPGRYRRRRMTVAAPAARSLSIIVSFRFQRSTRAPAIGLRITVGAKRNVAARARVVTSFVWRYAQITNANPVIPVPRRETVWPAQTRVNPRIPARKEDLRFQARILGIQVRGPGTQDGIFAIRLRPPSRCAALAPWPDPRSRPR